MINQAVILAGGLGKRLRPITDSLPKPLVRVAGKPFITHLIQQLKKANFKEIIILAGYKSDSFINFVKSYKDTSIIIKVIEQHTKDEFIPILFDFQIGSVIFLSLS